MQEVIFEEFILYKVQNNILTTLTLPFSQMVVKRIENIAKSFIKDTGAFMGYIDGVRFQDIYNIAQFMYDEKIKTYTDLANIPTKKQMISLINLLQENTSIHTVDLRNCNIDDDIALALIDTLKINKTIRRMDLRNNEKIGKELTRLLIEEVKKNKNIQHFMLHSYRIQEEIA